MLNKKKSSKEYEEIILSIIFELEKVKKSEEVENLEKKEILIIQEIERMNCLYKKKCEDTEILKERKLKNN